VPVRFFSRLALKLLTKVNASSARDPAEKHQDFRKSTPVCSDFLFNLVVLCEASSFRPYRRIAEPSLFPLNAPEAVAMTIIPRLLVLLLSRSDLAC
jgi:hypothetical protein